jgi:site-specific recombinase XerC
LHRLDSDVAIVISKGQAKARIPYGHRTGQASTRYLQARARHPPATFTGARRLSQMAPSPTRARSGAGAPSVQSAIARVHAHQLRNTAADRWLGESVALEAHGSRT